MFFLKRHRRYIIFYIAEHNLLSNGCQSMPNFTSYIGPAPYSLERRQEECVSYTGLKSAHYSATPVNDMLTACTRREPCVHATDGVTITYRDARKGTITLDATSRFNCTFLQCTVRKFVLTNTPNYIYMKKLIG